MTRSDPVQRRSVFHTVLFLFAAWLVTLVGWLLLYAEFRDTAAIAILGNRYANRDALLILAVCAGLPITLLAVAMRKLIQYNQRKNP